MSSYLVAFVISDLRNITNAPNYFPHRIFVRAQDLDAAEFGLAHGDVLLDALQDYVQVNYSLPKMDQIAISDMHFTGTASTSVFNQIPIDHMKIMLIFFLYFQAMENWGMI